MDTHKTYPVLQTNKLSIGYQSRKKTTVISDNIDFSLYQGELVGLIGANGIGKSTLLKTIIKSIPQLSGEILINNQDTTHLSNLELAQKLSIVLTENVSNTNLTVQELIALGRQPYTNWLGSLTNTDIEKVNEVLALIQITDLAQKRCHELSDGQLQKVMLARALAQDTNLIILDEPTTHLDLYHKAYILNLLQRLAKETNKTILFSTHEINVALSLCDKLVVMKPTNTSFGTPEELIKQQAFNDLFPKDLITFNADLKSFQIK